MSIPYYFLVTDLSMKNKILTQKQYTETELTSCMKNSLHISCGFIAFLVLLIFLRQWNPEGVLFYQGLICAALSACIQGVWARLYTNNPLWVLIKDATLVLLLSYAFMFTVPTTVDRAYTVNLIQQLASKPNGMSHTELEYWFGREFVAQGGIERRIKEQTITGTLRETDGQIVLTTRGEWLAHIFDFFQKLFNCGIAK